MGTRIEKKMKKSTAKLQVAYPVHYSQSNFSPWKYKYNLTGNNDYLSPVYSVPVKPYRLPKAS